MCFMNRVRVRVKCVSWFVETKSDVQTQQSIGLRMEKIHHHVLQFVDGTRNLWRQSQCWMQ